MLEKFGESFFEFCIESGYEAILRRLGPDLPTFVSGLDSLHDHLTYRFPGIRSPSFRISYERAPRNGFNVFYHSERPGLEHMIIGILKVAAKTLFDKHIYIKIASSPSESQPYTMFTVKMTSRKDTNNTPRMRRLSSSFEVNMACDLDKVIDPETFVSTFPFHVVIDRQLTICQAGVAVLRMMPLLKVGTTLFTDVFRIIRPAVPQNFNGILSYANSIFHVRMRHGMTKKSLQSPRRLSTRKPSRPKKDDSVVTDAEEQDDVSLLRLKGQMMYLKESETIIFLSSPRIFGLDGLSEKGEFFIVTSQ